MYFTRFSYLSLTIVIVASITAAPINAMMGPYLATLVGDAALLAGGSSLKVTQEMTVNDQKEMLEQGAKPSEISQLKKDAAKVAPYAPLLMPLGAVFSVGGRLSMLKRPSGLLLAVFSVPFHALLIAGSYQLRLNQAPDATIADKAADTGVQKGKEFTNWLSKITGKRNS